MSLAGNAATDASALLWAVTAAFVAEAAVVTASTTTMAAGAPEHAFW